MSDDLRTVEGALECADQWADLEPQMASVHGATPLITLAVEVRRLQALVKPCVCTTFDDDRSFCLSSFAGGANPKGLFGTVSCLYRHADGSEEIIHYERVKPDAIAKAEAEVVRAAESGLLAVANLIDNSAGVDGLHLNGDVASWESLRTGGRFEDWLVKFDVALNACAALAQARKEGNNE